MRHDGRAVQQLRPIKIETNVFKHPEGSVVISFGDTKVICSATLEDSVPPFLRGSESGWVTVCFPEPQIHVIVAKARKENYQDARWRFNV